MEEEKYTYKLWVECLNCGTRGEVEIKKGQNYHDTPCEHCGCENLFRLA